MLVFVAMVPEAPVRKFAAAVIIPEPVAGMLLDLQQRHGLKPWHSRIPLHITIISPFDTTRTPDEVAVLWQSIATRPSFKIHLKGFGRFDNDEGAVCFVGVVQSPEITQFADDAGAAVAHLREKRTRPFVPHVTLADEDTHDIIDGYMKKLAAEPLDTTFTCDRFALLQFNEAQNFWNVVHEFPLIP